MNEAFIRTDLACELGAQAISRHPRERVGYEYNEEERGGVGIASLTVINSEGERAVGKGVGRYITLSFSSMSTASDEQRETLVRECTSALRSLLGEDSRSVLVAGLGNRAMTPDALGPLCLDTLCVTRQLELCEPLLFDSLGAMSVSALEPGVLARTGIETFELVRGAVAHVRPDAVIAVDALAARSAGRLMRTIQLSDAGISPGAGVGNRRAELNERTLGVPVIAIGVPSVVDTSTLVCDALEQAGIGEPSDELRDVLERGRSFFVSPKDIDEQTTLLAKIISEAIDEATVK